MNSVVVLLIILGGLLKIDASNYGCPDIVIRSPHFAQVHNETCYLFINEEKYWKDARSTCWHMGGEMLSVRDQSTMQFIRSTLNSRQLRWFKQGVWLGARYTKGMWTWTTGDALHYSNWAPNEPSKFLGFVSLEDCAIMRRADNWRWHDKMCGTLRFHYNYICEFPFNHHNTHEAKSAFQSNGQGNVKILAIILAAGGFVLLILLLVFLFFNKRYSYKKASSQPSAHFENQNNNHTDDLVLLQPPQQCKRTFVNSNHLYLTPIELEAHYEEVGKADSWPSADWQVYSPGDGDKDMCAAAENVSFFGQSAESLTPMTSSLTIATSHAHNDYVDMNGSPVVSACLSQHSQPDQHKQLSMTFTGNNGITHPYKSVVHPDHRNVTSLQEPCENVYAHFP